MTQTVHVELNGKRYELNCKGFLVDMSAWDEQLRDWFAEQEKIELTDEHLKVIDFFRNYYGENNEHPVVRVVAADMVEKLGREKGTTKYFHQLFPSGIHQAYMIAGLPMKHSCC
jgi:tRNA 2-thiouridine synthesizing protein E